MNWSLSRKVNVASPAHLPARQNSNIEVAALCGLTLFLGLTLWALSQLLGNFSIRHVLLTLLLAGSATFFSMAPLLAGGASRRFLLSRAILALLAIAVWTFTLQADSGTSVAWALSMLAGILAISVFAAMGIAANGDVEQQGPRGSLR